MTMPEPLPSHFDSNRKMQHMLRKLIFTVTILCTSTPVTAADIVETITEAGTFNTLLLAATNAALMDTLNSEGPWTLFAPTDDAFAQMPRDELRDLLNPANTDRLGEIVRNHIIAGEITSRDILGKRLEAVTVDGGTLLIDATRNAMIEDARIVKADVIADNGFIHVIDAVMLPD